MYVRLNDVWSVDQAFLSLIFGRSFPGTLHLLCAMNGSDGSHRVAPPLNKSDMFNSEWTWQTWKLCMFTLNRITNLSEFRHRLNLSGDISSLESLDYGQRTVFRKVAEFSLLERSRCSRFTSGHVGRRIFSKDLECPSAFWKAKRTPHSRNLLNHAAMQFWFSCVLLPIPSETFPLPTQFSTLCHICGNHPRPSKDWQWCPADSTKKQQTSQNCTLKGQTVYTPAKYNWQEMPNAAFWWMIMTSLTKK